MNVSEAIAQLVDKAERIGCQKCGNTVDVSEVAPFALVQCPSCSARFTVPAKFGQFLLIQALSQEGSAFSFRARDRTLGRQVVVKLIADVADDPDAAKRFHEGARTLAALNHPHVVKVYSVGQEKGAPFIVMEMVSGGTLADTLNAGHRLDEASAFRMALDTVEGLRAAFGEGMVHGDIRPGNVIFTPDGAAKVMDFRLEWSDDRKRELERVLAHPEHVAPEAVQGQRGDHRGDIYSLGAMLFHAVTGHPPFQGATPADTVKARLEGPPPDMRQVDPMVHSDLADIVLRMMARNPDERYQSFDELADDLARAQQGVRLAPPAGAADPAGASASASRSASARGKRKKKKMRPASRSRTASEPQADGEPTQFRPRKKRKTPAWVGIVGAVVALAAIGGIIWAATALVGSSGTKAAPYEDSFNGPTLDTSWIAVGSAGRFDSGRYHLVQSAGASESGLRRKIGRGDFETVVRLDQIEWDPNLLARIRLTVNDVNGNSLIVELEKEQRNTVIFRVIDQRNNRMHAQEEKSIIVDPSAITLRLVWRESGGTWHVHYGLNGAAPAVEHPISPIKAGYSSTVSRLQQITIAADAGEGFFNVKLDNYSLVR